MKRIAVTFLFTAALAWSQKVELGATAGMGTFVGQGVSLRKFASVGVEACGWCTHRIAAFGEYSHWENVGTKDTYRIQRGDFLAGGVRFQGTKGVRPFFDAGLAGGQDRYPAFLSGMEHHNLIGAVLGGGAAIPLGERWYIRPQFRIYIMSGLHIATGGSVGVGYRF